MTTETYSVEQKKSMLQIAAASIRSGFEHSYPLNININNFEIPLQQSRATFVTLEINQQLRGCIGMLKAIRPLAEDISNNAYSAAFNDHRFTPLSELEYNNLCIKISILSPTDTFNFSSQQDLISQIRPNIDGLILTDNNKQSTFLPSVWETLPDVNDFLSHLKQKAGFKSDYWSNTIQFYRYTTFSFSDAISDIET